MYARQPAELHPDKLAIVMADSGRTVTYAEYEARANQAAHLLLDAGLRRGDHIAIFMANDERMLICEAGAERTGLYYTCVNSHLPAAEAAYIINDSQARLVVASSSQAAVTAQLPGLCPDVEHWLMTDASTATAPWESWDEVVSRYPAETIPDEQLGIPMLYSSGTTGRPKGIHRALPDLHPAAYLAELEPLRSRWRFHPDMVYLSPAPLYHAAPLASVSLALRLGASVVVMEHFDAARFLALVRQYRVTHSQMVPTMFSRLLKLPEQVRESADVSSLEAIIHAAAPCPAPVKEAMISWFGPILLEYYAATEGNGQTFCDSEEWLAHKGTVGRATVGEVLVLDDSGRLCEPGEIGMVWFRGATNFEYFNDPVSTAESRNQAGDTSTVGDVGYLDAAGYLYLTDRKSYMIISGGVNIYPQEAENVLANHPDVMDAAVIGVPDDEMGESVKAVIELRPGVVPGPDVERELIDYCRARLAHFKCPRSVDFTEHLPRLPTGKLYKRMLKDRYWAGRPSGIA